MEPTCVLCGCCVSVVRVTHALCPHGLDTTADDEPPPNTAHTERADTVTDSSHNNSQGEIHRHRHTTAGQRKGGSGSNDQRRVN